MSDKSYYDQPVTLEEIEATLHRHGNQTQSEKRFLGRVKSWQAKGARFKFSASFAPYQGHTFTAFFYVTSLNTSSGVSLSWTLRAPFTRTERGSFVKKCSVRFFGTADKREDEQYCSIAASNRLEQNAKYLDRFNERAETKRAVDGLAA